MARRGKKAKSVRSVDQACKDALKEDDVARGAMEYFFPDVDIAHAKLKQLPTVENAVVDRNDDSPPLRFERTRDSRYLVSLPDRNDRTVIGLEMQADADASMPVRSMVYDAIDLDSQKRAAAARHEKAKDLRKGEFIRGFSGGDRVMPVITGVINLGSRRIPESMKDVMHKTSFSRYVLYDRTHYVMNVRYVENAVLDRMEESARHFYYLLKYSGSKEFGEYINANKAYFENISGHRYDLICDILKMPGLKNIKKKIRTEKGGHDMCVGLKLYVEEQTRQKDAALKRKDTALKRKDKKIESLTADNRQKDAALKQSKRKIENLTKETRKSFVKIAKRYGASLESVISDYAAEYHVAPATAKKEVMAFWPMS